MGIREIFALVSASFMAVGTIWYIFCIVRKSIEPVLSSWIVLAGAMTLSFVTYLTTPKANFVSNIANTVGVASTLSTLATLVYFQIIRKEKIQFTPFQKKSLLSAGSIAIFWVVIVFGFGKTGLIPNILTQILMIIGFLATAQKLWCSTKNTEPFLTWIFIGVSCTLALYVAYVYRDGLAMLFATRGALSTLILVWLMHRANNR